MTSSGNPRAKPAYAGLIALIAQMRPDWDADQITDEIVGCPWNEQLIFTAVRATREDDDRLRGVADALIKTPSQRVPVTDTQRSAYADHVRRLLARNRTTTDE
ncbi:hypothetical protein SAMN05421505_12059 [Sinosporangium album]|uniref:Uncharacterized protein n=1 Tax=Sinosporangium album TaxID=504805 RepID=A0A1G8EDZ8_9ACTN|nr:hypothetical protein [Sinosporangium album]SDH68133.1 hypothetical protein SAMN05421505_12059 [Sinosporangium album]